MRDETFADVERALLNGAEPRGSRAVSVVLSPDWAQALTRLQQLHNEGCMLVRILEDERGRVRVEPGG